MFELFLRLIHQIMFLTGFVGGNSFPKQLTAEEEKKYLNLYLAGDMNAKNILIEHNLRLVAHIAKKYSNDTNTEDMISTGIIGLIKGINTFNPDKNPRLSAYISRCIENEILMVLRSGKKLSNEVSLEECIGTDREGNTLTLADILPAQGCDMTEKISLCAETERLYSLLESELDEAERRIVINRYGLYGKIKKTQREIAKDMDISRSYVSRIEKRALKKLAAKMGSEYEFM